MSKKQALAPIESVLVRYRCGKVSYVLLMKEDGSTSELRGVEMWFWLDEFARHLKVFPAKEASSKRTSSASQKQLLLVEDS